MEHKPEDVARQLDILDRLVDYGNSRVMHFNKCNDVGIHFYPDGRVHYLLSEAMVLELLQDEIEARVIKNEKHLIFLRELFGGSEV